MHLSRTIIGIGLRDIVLKRSLHVHGNGGIDRNGHRNFGHDSNEVVVAVANRDKGQWNGVQQTHNQAEEARDLHKCQQEPKADHRAKVAMNDQHGDANRATHTEEAMLFVRRNGKHGCQSPPNARENQEEEHALHNAHDERQGQQSAVVSAAEAAEEISEADGGVASDRVKYSQIKSGRNRGPEQDGGKQMQQNPHSDMFR